MQRPKPDDVPQHIWDAFEDWANSAGLREHPDDVKPWWECWKDGHDVGWDRGYSTRLDERYSDDV